MGIFDVILKKPLEHILCLALFSLCDGIAVHPLKHKTAQVPQGFVHRRRKGHRSCFPGCADGIGHQRIDALGVGMSQNIRNGIGDILIGQNARADRVVDIMVDIGDLITAAYHHALQCCGPGVTGMAENAVAHLVGQVQTPSVLFQHIHHTKALLIVAEGLSHAARQRILTGMTEGRMAQIVAHTNGLRQIFIESQCPCNGAGNAGNLQGVGHAGAVVIALRLQKNLRLVHQTAEGFAVDNAVNIPLIAGAHIFLPVFFETGAALALIRKGGKGIEPLMLLSFQFFFDCHTIRSFSIWEMPGILFRFPFLPRLPLSYRSDGPERAAPGLRGTAAPAPPQRRTGYPG